MNGPINQLVKSLLHKDSLDQCSLDELQQYADRYPYFGAAQLLLTKKLQTENTERYQNQLQKTNLFFHNPLWVQQLLNDTGTATIKAVEKTEQPVEMDLPVKEILPEPAQPVIIEDAVSLAEAVAEDRKPVIEPAPEAFPEITKAAEPVIVEKTEAESAAIVNTTDLIFEPYHTVDYFASQGIKFREEEKPVDKFSLQLKSFTEWLKTMKKLPVAEMARSVETASEKKVEQMAEHSLEDREIITEAMAEVWEKQGNREKAIEVYSKLSLLEPAKSPYFAAKIEILKKEN
ncbi:MAG: hypothetical protein JNK98_04310 [Chitinophagaceae bacterium]|nr:hypothetical protein [Chitinophagaceae bacterium]